MIYSNPLPQMQTLERLAKLARPFPKPAGSLVETARRAKLGPATIHFLELFPSDETFEDANDLLNRCEEIELFIREERAMPPEHLHNPQD